MENTNEEELVELTIDDLREIYNELSFFKFNEEAADFIMHDPELWGKAKDDEALRFKLYVEMRFVNKLQTIMRHVNWVAQYEHRPFHRGRLRKEVTNPKASTDAMGTIKGWGAKMSPLEFDTYLQFHEEEFTTEDV